MAKQTVLKQTKKSAPAGTGRDKAVTTSSKKKSPSATTAAKKAVVPAIKSSAAAKVEAKKSTAGHTAKAAAPCVRAGSSGARDASTKANAPAAQAALQMQIFAHSAIASIPKGMAAGRSVLKVLTEALGQFSQAVGYTQAVILQLTPDETCLIPVCSAGEAAALIDNVALDEPLEIMAERSVSRILGKAWSSGACLALVFQDTPLGLLCLGGGRASRPDAIQKQMLDLFAQQLSLCLYTSNLSEYKDLPQEAHDAARAELRCEDVPAIPEFDSSLHLLRGSACGGDFHAFIPLSNDRTGILFGKASGSGVCSLDVAMLIPQVRDQLSVGATLAEVMQAINQEIIRQGNRGRLVSVVLMVVDSRTRKARICRAGSVKMLRFKGGVLSVFDEALGPHLGAFSGVRLQEVELQFAPGDSLALMTDGINLFSEKKSAPLESLAEKLAARMANHKGVGLTGQVLALLREKHLPSDAEVTVLGLQRKSRPGHSAAGGSGLAEHS